VLGGQQASWDLPEGVYTFETFLNDSTQSRDRGVFTDSGTSTVGVTANDNFTADFVDGGLSSFARR
jgi:hypothetical protein